MAWFYAYLILSILFGIAVGIFFLYDLRNKKSPKDHTIESARYDENIRRSVQKETYGERVVFYPLNIVGRIVVEGSELLAEDYQKSKTGFFIRNVLSFALIWPVVLLDIATIRLRRNKSKKIS